MRRGVGIGLQRALGRNPQADAASTTNAGAAAPSASSSAPLYDLGPTTFAQINHASLSIDASWSDLLMAFRCAIGATEGPAERRRLQNEIAELFRSRPNVYDTPAEVAAGRERASRPPLAASASHMGGGEAAAAASYAAMAAASVAAASSASASPALPLASLVNANSSLPASFIAPAYLRSEHNILTALSARSCLDQWLTSKAFAPGSHVLLTAINIPDISVVLRAHKLVPVPVDIQLDTLAPNMERLEAACKAGTDPSRTEGRVVAILVAQLYGRRCDMDPIVTVAQRYSLQLIEDLAETFSGLDAIGHPQADLAFLSFGSIKVATAFGGGVCRVRDQSTWSDMRQRQDSWSTQTRHTFFMKCVKNTFAILALNVPLITGGLIRSGRTFNWDVKASVVAMMRGFPDRLMERLREQPSAALLSMIRYRLGNLDPTRFQEHQDKCDLLIDLLPSSPHVIVPGFASPVRNHWLLPVVVGGGPVGADSGVSAEHVASVQRDLNDNGVDAYRGATQLALVPPPVEIKDAGQSTPVASDVMLRTLYLPMHRAVPVSDIVRMALVMHKVVDKMERERGAAGQIQSKL